MTDTSDLNEMQTKCLRLVYDRFSAKEIGLKLGISPSTVHYHLTEARRLLGVSTSMEAARLLAAADKPADYDLVPVDEMAVAPPRDQVQPVGRALLPWPVPTKERPTNALTYGEKIVAIIMLTTLFMGVSAIYLIAIGAIDAAI